MAAHSIFTQVKRSPKSSRTTPEGIVFDSKAEMYRWYELQEKQFRGEIRYLERQKSFELRTGTDAVFDMSLQTDTGRVRRYTADFYYEEPVSSTSGGVEWREIWEEYKGILDETSTLRRNAFEMFMREHVHNRDFKVRLTGPAKRPRRKKA